MIPRVSDRTAFDPGVPRCCTIILRNESRIVAILVEVEDHKLFGWLQLTEPWVGPFSGVCESHCFDYLLVATGWIAAPPLAVRRESHRLIGSELVVG